jgi:hypothetical protein
MTANYVLPRSLRLGLPAAYKLMVLLFKHFLTDARIATLTGTAVWHKPAAWQANALTMAVAITTSACP